MKGVLSPASLEEEVQKLEVAKDEIIPRKDGHGTDE